MALMEDETSQGSMALMEDKARLDGTTRGNIVR